MTSLETLLPNWKGFVKKRRKFFNTSRSRFNVRSSVQACTKRQHSAQDAWTKCFHVGTYIYHLLVSLAGILLNEHQIARIVFLMLFMLGFALLVYYTIPSRGLDRVSKTFAIFFLVLIPFYFALPLTAPFVLALFSTLFILVVNLVFGPLFGICT